MGLTEFALCQSLYMGLNHVDKKELIKRVADEFDKLTDQRLGEKGSEKLQVQIVEKVLLPLARELMKETPFAYEATLRKEYQFVGGSDFISGELGQVPRVSRSNVQPKNR